MRHELVELYGLRGPRQRVPAPPAPPGRAAHACHACGCARISRDPAVGLCERLVLVVLARRAYRCLNCGQRFHDRPHVARPVSGLKRGAAPRPMPLERTDGARP